MKKYLQLLRVKHYIKNFLIFLPIIFNKSIGDINKLILTIIGFISFSFISSSIYIINDINDVHKDRLHPVKKNRPIANGSISILKAKIISILLVILSLGLVIIFRMYYDFNIITSICFLILYFGLNVIYSLGLKNVPILDIAILASGFLIRVLFGGAITSITVSSWLYLTIISMSFYLGLGKRRNELKKHKGKDTRAVLKYYNKDFLDSNMYVFSAVSLVFYSLWAQSYQNQLVLWTIPIVMIIVMKYNLDIESSDSEGDPINVIMHDLYIFILGIVYMILIFFALYV